MRSAVIVGPSAGGWAAYFGDLGKVHSVDALTGKALWTARIEDHPAAVITGAPTLVRATLFVPVSSFEEVTGANPNYSCCTFRGSLVALEASTGKVLWKAYTISEPARPGAVNSKGVQLMGPSGAAIWSAPTFDAASRKVYVTTGDNYSDPPSATSDAILALNSNSGELAWSRQMTSGDAFNLACGRTVAVAVDCPKANGLDYDFGSSALLAELPGGKRILIGAQKSGVVTALDPDRAGEIVWQKRVGNGGERGGVQWGVAADQRNVYVAVSDLKIVVVPAGTPGAQAIANAPGVSPGRQGWRRSRGAEARYRRRSLADAAPRLWRGSPLQPRAIGRRHHDPRRGVLRRPRWAIRAYSSEDGRILWDVDTKGVVRTVNGVAAHGGSIDGAGPVVVGGMLYVSSGAGIFGGAPGNVLLAYSVDGR